MQDPCNKVLVIGIDAPIPGRLLKYVDEGKLPHLAQLIERGVWAENCLGHYPTNTPPNWTTIATGARPGTHGITDFYSYDHSEPLTVIHPNFTTEACRAEHIWTAAERVGKKSIVINYPASWPAAIKSGYQIGGAGIGVNEWRLGMARGGQFTICFDQAFCTVETPLASQVAFRPAGGWRNAPQAGVGVEAELQLRTPMAVGHVEPRTWHLLVQDSEGQGFDRVVLSLSKDVGEAFAVLREGQWSPVISQEFETGSGPRTGIFRSNLVELSSDAEEFRLYVTPICAADGWSYPASLAAEIRSEHGLPASTGESMAFNLGWIDLQTYVELQEIGDTWLGDSAAYLMANKEWSLLYMHMHSPDRFHHDLATKMDPLTNADEQAVSRVQEAELHIYQVIDGVVGRLVALAGEDTLVVIVSDHGAKASGHRVNVGQILAQAGLTVYRETVDGQRQVDGSRSKAVVQRSCYVYVNVKGRNPDGIVAPGGEYEDVRDQIIAALYDYDDPGTGKKPIALALRKEDARVLGLYGDGIGDVVFALGNEWGGQHGVFLPTAEFGLGQVKPLLIMAGPGLKKGLKLERTVWLSDLVPTICHLAELPMPKDAEGAIIYQALKDPDEELAELQWLRMEYARARGGLEAV